MIRNYIIINQLCWRENGFETLDIIDLALYDYIKSFMLSNKCEYIIVNQKPYYWISPVKVIEDMPILGITTARNINVRINKLIEVGLLEGCHNNRSEKKTYITTGYRYQDYECYSPTETQKSEDGCKHPSGTWMQTSKYSNINIDRNNKEINKEKNNAINTESKPTPQVAASPLPFAEHLANSAEFMYLWGELMKEKKWKTKSQRALKMSVDKLNTVSIQDAIEAVKDSIERGYQGIFPKATRPIASPVRSTQQTSLEELMGGK